MTSNDPGGGINRIWPQSSINPEEPNAYSAFENEQNPFKRRRDSENNIQVQANGSMQPVNTINMGTGSGTRHIFYKTRICQPFIEGKCWMGDRCSFAHGHDDLREAPQNWREIVSSIETKKGVENWNNDERIIQRKSICRKFYNGETCPYGDQCNFLHDEPSKFKSSDINMMGNQNNYDQNQIDIKSNAFEAKTRLCTKWEVTGFCPFGERCQFAHGDLEKQHLDDRSNNTENKPAWSFMSKWKKSKKINGIYGDWLDGMSPPRS